VARPWLAILPLFIGGFSAEALQAGATTLLQQTVPDALRGRVESALITIVTASLMTRWRAQNPGRQHREFAASSF